MQSSRWEWQRRDLQSYIAEMSGVLRAEGYPVVITDIAAGPGRYVLDVVSRLQPRPDRLLLRDYNPLDVQQGRTLLREYGLDDIGIFDQADAFDRHSLASLDRPTLAIACGIYELFPDNSMIRDSLSGLADAIPLRRGSPLYGTTLAS